MRINRDSEWFAPLIMGGGVIVFFSLIIGLIFLIRPPLRELGRNQRPIYMLSSVQENIHIGALQLQIPQNHIRSIKKTEDQSAQEVFLHALLPNMQGYRQDNWWLFEEKTANARMILIRIAAMKDMLNEETRFHHLYSQQLEQNRNPGTPTGLDHYFYKDKAIRLYQDIFTGHDHYNRRLIYFCFRPSQISVAPHCSRTFAIAFNTALTYRFKRTHLSNWRQIDSDIQNFIKRINQLSHLPPKRVFSE